MTETVTVQIDPPQVEFDDVEEFLATDDLFVEYFNAYLALPTFPELLCFNSDSGGFEVVSEARQELARQIKAAVRSRRPTPPIYRLTRRHAFSDIPLVPINPPKRPDKMEIDTTFNVMTLNKEQGIHWVKAERLPTFLQSDCYFEYRLAHVLSQVRLADDKGHFVLTKIDFSKRPPKTKKKQEEVKFDLKEVYMKEMFVSVGLTPTASVESWFADAKMVHTTEPTYVTLSRPVSASRPVTSSHTFSSTRPATAGSIRSTGRRPDSGFSSICSPKKSSVFASHYLGSYDAMPLDDIYSHRSPTVKPYTPRPSEPVCCTVSVNGPPVYAYPKHAENTDTESGLGDISESDLADDSVASDDDTEVQTSRTEEDEDGWKQHKVQAKKSARRKPKVVLSTLDDLSEVIVAVVLKTALAQVARMDQSQLERDSRVRQLFPDNKYKHITLDMLDNAIAIVDTPPAKEEDLDINMAQGTAGTKKGKTGKANEDESDVDSLLDSDDDYEEQDAKFFRRHIHPRTYNLLTRKGIQHFKHFLRGTVGEKLWLLWKDIDRLVHAEPIACEEDLKELLRGMRERYHMYGGPYELPDQLKTRLSLSQPSQWTVDTLRTVQPLVAKPLILYWAPRFLLKQLMRCDPGKYQQYRQQQGDLPISAEAPPIPPAVLPLRPKSCMARIQQHKIVVEDLWKGQDTAVTERLEATSPRVGMRRVHGPPATQPTEVAESVRKKPRELLMTHLKAHGLMDKLLAPGSTVSSASQSKPSSARSRSKSSVPPSAATSAVERRGGKSPTSRPATALSGRVSPTSQDKKKRLTSTGPRSRPLSAQPQRYPSRSNSSSSSLFDDDGGKLEGLLQALYHERDSGHFFRVFLKKSGNKIWLDAEQLWEEVQEYRLMFYQEKMDPFFVRKHAQAIYVKYVVPGCPQGIGCDAQVEKQVRQCLSPPQEELFDQAEEEALKILYSAWMAGLAADMQIYNKVELIEVPRHLDSKNKYLAILQRSGVIKERGPSPDELVEKDFEDPLYDPAAWKAVPEDFQDYTLEKLVNNRLELEHFKQFLAEKYADTDLKCWMDMEIWRRMSPQEARKREQKALEIRKVYLNRKYFFGPNSPAGKESQNKVMKLGGGWGKLLDTRLSNSVLLEAQRYVRERLQKKWLPLFLATRAFTQRQRPKTSMDDVVDDVLIHKRRRSMTVWKMMESKWISSSKEIFLFRKALMNPVTSLHFRRFVSTKGDHLENDVLFWQEVQKYKQMHHAHTQDSFLSQKISAVINCFIDSSIPPSLQVDLPQDMVNRILDRKKERSPYIFREAQLAVFRILFSYWHEFCELRRTLGHEKVLPTIERLRRHAKARQRRRQLELEKKAEAERSRHLAAEDSLFRSSATIGGSQLGESKMTIRKDKIEFSYYSYMQELSREDILNVTEESIFSSLADISGSSAKVVVSGHNDNNNNQEKRASVESKSPTSQSVSPLTVPVHRKNSKPDSSQVDLRPLSVEGNASSHPQPISPTTVTHMQVKLQVSAKRVVGDLDLYAGR